MDRLREVHVDELAERFVPLRTCIIEWSLTYMEQTRRENPIACFLGRDNQRTPSLIGDDSVDAYIRRWRSDYHFDEDEDTLEVLDDD